MIQDYLIQSQIDWRLLQAADRQHAEREWRSIFTPIDRWGQNRAGAKAVFEYSNLTCDRYLVVPFGSDVEGLPMNVRVQHRYAYECRGRLVPFGEFCDFELFVASAEFDWTMIHVHENFAFGGPYFVRREWLRF